MTSRISFFNPTVFKKDILRFSPLWGIYTAYLLFICVMYLPNTTSSELAYSFVNFAPPVNLYCFLCATFLFGDLFKGKICNALHALPLRRETWLFTHIAAGLLFSILPHTLCTLIMSVALKENFFFALLWLVVTLGKVLFHFTLAVFCAMCVGNRLGHIVIYMFVSYFSVLVQTIYSALYDRFLYGIPSDIAILEILSPVLHWSGSNFFEFTVFSASGTGSYNTYVYTYKGIVPQMWIHLGVCTVLSIPLTIGATLLYQRRNLENAENFVTTNFFRWMLLFFGSLFTGIIFPVVGYPLGFFGISMLMERSLKVFGKKHWIKFSCFTGAILLTIGLTKLDPLGLVERIPNTDEIKSVSINEYNSEDNSFTFTDPEHIDVVRTMHSFALSERKEWGYYNVNIIYTLTSGKTMQRTYYIDPLAEQMKPLRKTLSSFKVLFGTEDIEELKKDLVSVVAEATTGSSVIFTNIQREDYDELFQVLTQDSQTGSLVQNSQFHNNSFIYKTLKFYFSTGQTIELDLYIDSTNIHSFLANYK